MKSFKIYCMITTLVLFFASCETEVVDPAGLRGVGVVPEISNLDPAVYDSNDLENTFIQFTVDAPGVSEVSVVASFKGNQKRVEVANVNSFPATLKLSLNEVASKLGVQLSSILPADVVNIELITVKDGVKYYSSAAFNAAVVCGYDPAMVTGSYHAVSDDWGLDGNVTITVDPTDEYVVYVSGLAAVEGLDETGPLKMIINSKDYSVNAVKSVLAPDVAPWDLPYTGYYYEGFGTLNSCDGTFTMTYTIGIDQGSWGANNFVLTKNP